jgi:vesicle transport through interaction with t-SNAREs protein 1
LIDSDIAEAEALVRRMDLEARSMQTPAVKDPMAVKLREYKNELARLKREAATAFRSVSHAQRDRAQLLAGAELDDLNAPTSSSQRERILQATSRLDQTGDRIREGKRTLLDTEELGVSILQDLHRQRDVISSARETIHGADDTLSKSRKILSNMGRRILQNKLLMYGIIGMLVLAIALVAYFKVGGGGKSKNETPL